MWSIDGSLFSSQYSHCCSQVYILEVWFCNSVASVKGRGTSKAKIVSSRVNFSALNSLWRLDIYLKRYRARTWTWFLETPPAITPPVCLAMVVISGSWVVLIAMEIRKNSHQLSQRIQPIIFPMAEQEEQQKTNETSPHIPTMIQKSWGLALHY